MGQGAVVAVVDDDESIRESLPALLEQLGYDARAFASAEEFLASDDIATTQCMILDVTMPGMTGPELQRELRRRGDQFPIIFITAQRDINVRSRLIKEGAVACLFKPFNDQDLQMALDLALPRD